MDNGNEMLHYLIGLQMVEYKLRHHNSVFTAG